MNKKTIITILLAIIAKAGQAQVPLESVKKTETTIENSNEVGGISRGK